MRTLYEEAESHHQIHMEAVLNHSIPIDQEIQVERLYPRKFASRLPVAEPGSWFLALIFLIGKRGDR